MANIEKRELLALVVEDDKINQKLAGYYLKKHGYTVTFADDGHEALGLLDANKFDVVLMDVNMPLMDGYSATTAFRKKEKKWKGRLPIIALTAATDTEAVEKCMEAGMDGFIAKPISNAALGEILERFVVGKTAAEELFSRVAALKVCDDDPQLLGEVAEMFLKDAPRQMERIRLAVLEKDFMNLEFFAHKLKGGASNLAARKLALAADEVENCATNRDANGFSLSGALLEMADKFMDELKTAL
ncbi:MAG: response regulator [Nitrospinae bacterium]|nr:response regulator [Nitrospinota bacterium]